jgi:hypothetical protein
VPGCITSVAPELVLRLPALVSFTAKYATVLAATFLPAASVRCNKAAACAMVSWISSEASSAPIILVEAGMEARILGTTSVHNMSPASGLIIFVLSGVGKKQKRLSG